MIKLFFFFFLENIKFFHPFLCVELAIVYQSPQIITCRGMEEVELYCVINVLAITTDYKWHTPKDQNVPSSPVIHVTEPGIYFCTVWWNGIEITSKPTEISVIPGLIIIMHMFVFPFQIVIFGLENQSTVGSSEFSM